jgi:hypothetical protein
MITDESIIEKSLKNGFSYTEYRNHVTQLLMDGLSTGATQSEALTHYTTLNEVRMNRLDKTIKLTDDIKARLAALKKQHTLLVISEGWCGDAAQILPVINKMAQASDKLTIEIVLRDENDALMNEYLTNGSRSIPKLVVLDDNLHARGSWGPRPQGGAQLIREYKEKFGALDQQVKADLQKWYLVDKGHSTMEEIMLLLENVE